MKANQNHEEIQLYLSLIVYKITLLKKFCIHNEIVEENGVEVFIANIKKYTDNTKIIEYSCTILYFLLTIQNNNTIHVNVINKILEDIKSQIITTNCIEIIFKAINIFIKNVKINEHTMIDAAFVLLRKLCSIHANNNILMKTEYINIIITTINKYKKNESFVIYCLNFLKYIYCDFPTIKIQDDPIQFRDIEFLVTVIKLYINNTRIIVIICSILSRWYELNPVNLPEDTSSCGVLEIVFLNNEYFTKLIDDPIYNIKNTTVDIEVIFEVIEKHRSNTNVMTICCLILTQYIYIKGDLAVIKIVNMKGIYIAIESLKTHIENKTIRSSVCFLLGTLCKLQNTLYLTKSNKTIQQDIFKTGCIEYAMMTLQQKTNNVMELNNASLLLASISLDNENSEIVTEIINHGSFKVILGAMVTTKQKNRVILAYHICCLIINILIANINHNNSMKFAKEGGIEVVIQIMKDFMNDRGLCNPLKLLCLISNNKDLLMSIATAIGTEGGFPFLLEFINIRTEDKYDNKIHEHTTEILNNLAKEQYILNKMKNDKVLEWIEKTIKNNTNMTKKTYQEYQDLITILR
jgi:phosphoribosyl-ATP pyrophosphohydrolase